MTFLNPFVLLGLAAAAIPLVIHLFNFRRPRRVDFSSLAFLRELEKRTMQRIRVRQWLLLALRTLALVCLVLAFAQPALMSAWDGLFAGRPPTAIALVVDNSLSMTQRDAQGAYIDQARALAAALVDATPAGDRLFLISTARGRPQPLTGFTTSGPALDALENLSVQAGAQTGTAAVSRAASLLETVQHPSREVFLFSDLQASTLTDSAIAALPENVRLTLVPFGAYAHTNTAVTDVRVLSRLIEPGRPVTVEATLVRYGAAADNYAASIWLDGQQVAQRSVDLPADTPTPVQFTFTPPRRGWLAGEVRIEADDAPWDDTRYFTLHVPVSRRVLVVRGSDARTDLVALALGTVAERGGLEVETLAESALAAAGVERYDAVFLVGLSALSSGTTALLERYVRGGGGLALFPSDEPGRLNTLLGALGAGQFIGLLGEPNGDDLGGFGRAELDHPLFVGVFGTSPDRSRAPALENPRIAMAARYVPSGTVQTLINLGGGTPFLGEVRHGEGRALVYAVAPDPRWSDLPMRGLFIPLLYRSAIYLATDDVGARHLTVESTASLRVENATGSAPLRLDGPGDAGPEHIPLQRAVPGGVVLEMDALSEPGVYAIREGQKLLQRIAVNVDSRESNLAPVTPQAAQERLESQLGAEVRMLDPADGLNAVARLQREQNGVPLWTLFLALALSFLVAELVVSMQWKKQPLQSAT